jgi:lysozyme family protein
LHLCIEASICLDIVYDVPLGYRDTHITRNNESTKIRRQITDKTHITQKHKSTYTHTHTHWHARTHARTKTDTHTHTRKTTTKAIVKSKENKTIVKSRIYDEEKSKERW